VLKNRKKSHISRVFLLKFKSK